MASFKWKWVTGGALKSLPQKLFETGGRLSFTVPKKYEGTVVDKAAIFIKNLYLDYKEMVVETIASGKKNPKRTVAILTSLGFLGYCSTVNPDEQSFREQIISSEHDVMVIGESIRSPRAVQHLQLIEKCYNEGRIRRLSAGFLSFIWIADYDRESAAFEAQCSYLKPKLSSYPSRIVDIGLLGKWWLVSRIMKDYDVNPAEFNEENFVIDNPNSVL